MALMRACACLFAVGADTRFLGMYSRRGYTSHSVSLFMVGDEATAGSIFSMT